MENMGRRRRARHACAKEVMANSTDRTSSGWGQPTEKRPARTGWGASVLKGDRGTGGFGPVVRGGQQPRRERVLRMPMHARMRPADVAHGAMGARGDEVRRRISAHQGV